MSPTVPSNEDHSSGDPKLAPKRSCGRLAATAHGRRVPAVADGGGIPGSERRTARRHFAGGGSRGAIRLGRSRDGGVLKCAAALSHNHSARRPRGCGSRPCRRRLRRRRRRLGWRSYPAWDPHPKPACGTLRPRPGFCRAQAQLQVNYCVPRRQNILASFQLHGVYNIILDTLLDPRLLGSLLGGLFLLRSQSGEGSTHNCLQACCLQDRTIPRGAPESTTLANLPSQYSQRETFL